MPSGKGLSGKPLQRLAKECFKMKKKRKYTRELPRRMYSFFISATEGASPPSFSKFARSIGLTLAELDAMREHSEFESAWRECNEIRRDYLIDKALLRRFFGVFLMVIGTTELLRRP
jgi:heme oxygenase